MEERGPWTQRASSLLCSTSHFGVMRDEVTRPDGLRDHYDWVDAPDQVRVAALINEHLLLIEQFHYLVGPLWQLPGGTVDAEDADPCAAARRELAEETGYTSGTWSDCGFLYPMPGLTGCRVHLWRADYLSPGLASPESAEADLQVRHVPLREAARAVRDGRIRCAPSAALVLSVTSGH
ncbi:NUDIX domain-containing protein [Streptomyces sp. NPDC096032]|uniref:NUDIX domain-containing protein n=1 Tax=Streptomyces sp. NPDC096032 TaxID=3366070 RepID=UPI003824E434